MGATRCWPARQLKWRWQQRIRWWQQRWRRERNRWWQQRWRRLRKQWQWLVPIYPGQRLYFDKDGRFNGAKPYVGPPRPGQPGETVVLIKPGMHLVFGPANDGNFPEGSPFVGVKPTNYKAPRPGYTIVIVP